MTVMDNKSKERLGTFSARIGQLATTRYQLAAQIKALTRRMESIDADLDSLIASAAEADMGAREFDSVAAVLKSLQAPEPKKKPAEAKVIDIAEAPKKEKAQPSHGPL